VCVCVCACVLACVCKDHSIMTLNNTEWYYVRHFLLNCDCLRLSSMLSNGPKRARVKGHWRELHSEEFQDLYYSPNNIHIIRSTKMRWEGKVARTGE